MEIKSEVAQPGPKLWNSSYDSLLRLDMPEKSHFVGYADNVTVHVAWRAVEQDPDGTQVSLL